MTNVEKHVVFIFVAKQRTETVANVEYRELHLLALPEKEWVGFEVGEGGIRL